MLCFLFFKQKTAYEMRIGDWSSDVCSSDLMLKAWNTGHPGGIALLRPRTSPTMIRSGRRRSVERTRSAIVTADRKSVVSGKSVSVRVDLDGGRIIKTKIHLTHTTHPPVIRFLTHTYMQTYGDKTSNS